MNEKGFFTKWLLELVDPNQPTSPMPAPGGESPPQPESAQDQKQKMEVGKDVFSDLAGKKIAKIQVNRDGSSPASGAIQIYFSDSAVPLTISWANGSMQVSKPNGEVTPLT